MKIDELSFGTFREAEPNIMEIIIHEGVELRSKHIDQIEKGLLEKYGCPYACLINRVNRYSHTHDSMQRVAKMQNLTRLAIVVYSSVGELAAKIHRLYQDNVRVFDDREKAISWLRESIVAE
jgi:uncharacterized protein (DUF2384 family)